MLADHALRRHRGPRSAAGMGGQVKLVAGLLFILTLLASSDDRRYGTTILAT